MVAQLARDLDRRRRRPHRPPDPEEKRAFRADHWSSNPTFFLEILKYWFQPFLKKC
jgi:hypothetical protein